MGNNKDIKTAGRDDKRNVIRCAEITRVSGARAPDLSTIQHTGRF